jgi:hypothetical protein
LAVVAAAEVHEPKGVSVGLLKDIHEKSFIDQKEIIE